MEVRTDQINGFLPLFSHHHNSDLSYFLDLSDEPGDGEPFGLSIDEQRDVSIGRGQGHQRGHFCLFPMDPEDRIGFELRDHMIATRSTDFNQCFCPVPTVSQDIEFTGKREAKVFDHPLGQNNFGLKRTTSTGSLGMIESGPEGEEELLIKQGRKDPLMTKDIGHVLSMVLMPATSGDMGPCLMNERIIDDKKENRSARKPQNKKKPFQRRLGHLLHSPTVLSQESSKA
jgi:hypothetical protein